MADSNGSISILLELIDKASPELTQFSKNYQKASDTITKQSASMATAGGKGIDSLGAAFTRLAGPIAAITAAVSSLGAVFEIAFNYADKVDTLGDMAEKYGYSASQVAILDRAVKDAGGSLEAVQNMQGRVASSLSKTGDEAGKTAEAFDRLGIKTTDIKGNLRSYVEVTEDIAKKVKEGNLTTQNYADIITVAGKSAMDASVSVNAVAEAQKFANEMFTEGIGITEEAVEIAGEYEKVSAKVSFILDSMGSAIMQVVIPAFTDLKKAFIDSYTNGGLVAQAFDAIVFAARALTNMIQILSLLFVGLDTSASILMKTFMSLGRALEILFTTPWGEKSDAFKKEWDDYWAGVVKTAEDAQVRIIDITNRFMSGNPSTGTIAAPSGGKAAAEGNTPAVPGKTSTSAADSLAKAFDRAREELLKQAAGYKELIAIEQVEIQIRDGAYKKFTPLQQEELRTIAKRIDLKRIEVAETKSFLTEQQKVDITLNNLNRAQRDAAKYYEALTTEGKDAADAIQAATNEMRKFDDEYIALGHQLAIAEAAGETKKVAELTAQLEAKNKELAERGESITQKAKETSVALAETARKQAAWNTVIGSTQEAYKQLAVEEELANKLFDEGVISLRELTAELERIDSSRIDLAAQKMTEFEKTTARIALDFQAMAADTFYDAMQGQFDLTLDGFKKMIDKMVAEMLARKLATYLFGDVTKTGQTSSSGVATDLLGGIIKMFGFRAGGGDVVAGQPYIVGEKRAELFVPSVNGTILPSLDSAAGMQSAGNNLSISITAMDSQDVIRAMDKIKRPLAEMMNGTNRSYNLGVR